MQANNEYDRTAPDMIARSQAQLCAATATGEEKSMRRTILSAFATATFLMAAANVPVAGQAYSPYTTPVDASDLWKERSKRPVPGMQQVGGINQLRSGPRRSTRSTASGADGRSKAIPQEKVLRNGLPHQTREEDFRTNDRVMTTR
jgi:hypothetical protein